MQLAGAFSGAVLTENIFSWPGMGTMISNAINNRDYSLIQGTVMVIAIAFVVVNLLTDLTYMLINPKFAAETMRRNG
jgi:peptide/nickel transport system permease protein